MNESVTHVHDDARLAATRSEALAGSRAPLRVAAKRGRDHAIVNDALCIPFRAALLALVALFTMNQSTALAAEPGSVSLYPQAQVADEAVRLRDVAKLAGEGAEQFADVVVARFEKQQSLQLTSANLRRSLDERGVNWGELTLGGYASCEVTRLVPVEEPKPQPAEQAEVVVSDTAMANPVVEVAVDTGPTVRDWVVDEIARLMAVQRDELSVTFALGDSAVLDRSLGADRYEFQPFTKSLPGRLLFALRRHQAGRVASTHHLTVDVAQRCRAAVALRAIERGAVIAPGDVQLTEVFLTELRGEPVTRLADVVGQQVSSSIKSGAVVLAADLQAPLLVRRGELVSVACVYPGVVVRTVARAMDNASLNQVIEARNERSREVFLIKVTGTGQALVADVADVTEGTDAANSKAAGEQASTPTLAEGGQ